MNLPAGADAWHAIPANAGLVVHGCMVYEPKEGIQEYLVSSLLDPGDDEAFGPRYQHAYLFSFYPILDYVLLDHSGYVGLMLMRQNLASWIKASAGMTHL
jgi:hypothetical protein